MHDYFMNLILKKKTLPRAEINVYFIKICSVLIKYLKNLSMLFQVHCQRHCPHRLLGYTPCNCHLHMEKHLLSSSLHMMGLHGELYCLDGHGPTR